MLKLDTSKHIKFFNGILISLCVFLIATSLSAAKNQHIRFNNIDVDIGLSNNTVLSVLQDSRGFIWIGTETGLNLYNGYDIKVYRHAADDSTSLTSNGIGYMYLDNKDNLWVLNQGIDKYDPGRDAFTRMNLKTGHSTSMTQDQDGNYWFEANNKGLYKYSADLNSHTYYSSLKGSDMELKVEGEIADFLVDDDNTLWLATRSMGLIRYNEKRQQLSHFSKKNSFGKLPHDEILSLFKYDKNTLWVGTREGLRILDLTTNKISDLRLTGNSSFLYKNTINCIVEDKQGCIWISTDAGLYGLNKKTGQYKSFLHDEYDPYSLKVNNISRLFIDRQGLLWVGTRRGGASYGRLNASSFVHDYRRPGKGANTLTSNLILSMCYDSEGYLWLGTESEGLNRVDRKKGEYKSYYHKANDNSSINGNTIQALFEDSKGNLWVGMYGNGLSRYNRKTDTFSSYLVSESFLNGRSKDNVMDIFEDSNGNIWIATNGGGIILLDPLNRDHKRFVHDVNNPQSLVNDHCITIREDSYGKMWIGTYAGLSAYDPESGTFKNYVTDTNNKNSISNMWIYSILEDSKKNLWIATSDGLNLYNRSEDNFTVMNESDGLPNYVINGIMEDEKGNLWISTNNGLSMFKTTGIHLARNYSNALKQKFSNFDLSDGLQALEFNAGVYCKSKEGEMFFGGINGYNSFYPQKVSENSYIPPVYISNFEISHAPVEIATMDSPLKKHISQTKELYLDYKQSTMTFEFVALNYFNSAKNEYAYFMEGLDDEWIYGFERKVTYNRLEPGEYVFHVKASNNNDVWNEQGASLKIIITPPFWETMWFRITAIVLLSISAVFWYKRRVYNLNKHRERLKRQIRARTWELKEKNKDLTVAKKEMDNILQNVKEGLFLIDKNLNFESQHSAALNNILVTKSIAKTSFVNYFKGKTDDKTVNAIKEFMELAFQTDTDEETMHALSPLVKIELTFNVGSGPFKKFLTFDFGKIKEKNQTVSLIASVDDITERVQLEKNLEETKRENRQKMERLYSVLSIDPRMLKDFVESTKEELSFMGKLLTNDESFNTETLDAMYRSIHTIKGNSSLLQLNFFTEQTHLFEDVISAIRVRNKYDDKDRHEIKMQLVLLNDVFKEIEKLIEKLGSFNSQFQSEKSKEAHLFIESLKKLTSEVAKDNNVRVNLETENFKNDLIPDKYQLIVRDILIQLIRNSVFHGIEPEAERLLNNKNARGVVEIQSYELGDSILIKVEDDGRGLQVDKLREKAKSSGRWDEREIDNWREQQVYNAIFTPGISTADKVSVNAGRGVGMDIIKMKLENIGGTIRIDSKEGKYCQFVIEMPKLDLYDILTEKIISS